MREREGPTRETTFSISEFKKLHVEEEGEQEAHQHPQNHAVPHPHPPYARQQTFGLFERACVHSPQLRVSRLHSLFLGGELEGDVASSGGDIFPYCVKHSQSLILAHQRTLLLVQTARLLLTLELLYSCLLITSSYFEKLGVVFEVSEHGLESEQHSGLLGSERERPGLFYFLLELL